METETIDLTDPLKDILKQTNWTRECLSERLSLLSEDNGPARKKQGDITLTDLLFSNTRFYNPFKIVKSVSDCNEVFGSPEIIELSDDEVPEKVKFTENDACDGVENVTEVRVIEVSDISDQSEEDDDLFDESSASKSSLSKDSVIISHSESQFHNSQDNVDIEFDCLNVKVPSADIPTSDYDQQKPVNNIELRENSGIDGDLPSSGLTGEADNALSHIESQAISNNSRDILDKPNEKAHNSEEPCSSPASSSMQLQNQPNEDETSPQKGGVADIPAVIIIYNPDEDSETKNCQSKLQPSSSPTEQLGFSQKIEGSEEHESSKPNADDTKALSEELESLEEIRSKLKAQLTNLRTRKKVGMLQDVKQTVDYIGELQKRSEDKANSSTSTLKAEYESVFQNSSLEDQPEACVDSQKDEHIFNEIRKIIRKPKSAASSCSNVPLAVNKVVTNDLKSKINADDLGVKNELNNSVVSPFVSNKLDEFLVNSKLNVSYTIPKSGAEAGLQRNYPVEPVISFEAMVKNENREKAKEDVKYKPKTLAEKRRFLERNKVRLQKRLDKLQVQEELQRRSYVLFKNRKVYVRSKMAGKCMARIESDESANQAAFRKPSLLTDLYRKASVKYKPGPLCRKSLLQSDCSRWTSELKKLPVVALNVMPELGKPVHQNLLPTLLSHWNSDITDNQVEFALMALASKTKPNSKIFTFDVPFERGQEKLLVRKKVPDKPRINKPNHISDYNHNEDISRVIEKLITYVEIKEMASTLIKDDDLSSSVETPEISSNSGKHKKVFRKLSRTNKELLRLSCKVVSVEAKQTSTNAYCPKSYCKLGCVCESLMCESTVRLHCQKSSCIFGCLCPKEKSKILSVSEPAAFGTEFLSMDAVTRIEGEAKKNMAKVEREFTQTVICANDKTIVVGLGDKSRRTARMPRKYGFFEEDNENISYAHKIKSCKPCFVFVEKWDFADLIPYCLVHHLYNCHCKGTSMSSSENSSQPRARKPIYKRKIEESSGRPVRKKKCNYKSDFILYGDTPFESLDAVETNCSRTCEVPKKHRSPKKFTSSATHLDFSNRITEADIMKLHESDGDILESERLKIDIIKLQKKLFDPQEHRKGHQRKQQIEVRQDEELTISQAKVKKGKVNSVFRGEIIINDVDLLKKLYNNTRQPPLDGYARILPWTALIKGFVSKSINVYCIYEMPLRLLLNVGQKITGDKILDIEKFGHKILESPLKAKAAWLVSQCENVRDIIKWLLSGTLSSKYKSNSLSFLLVETLPGQFEVRGLCTQIEHAQEPKHAEDVSGESDEITEIKHKNMNNEVESLFITKQTFLLRELVEDGFDDDLTDNLYMWVGLPEVYKVAKWRVIFLTNDFVYLYFKNIKYSIKYADLVKLAEMAKNEKATFLVRNLQIRRSYEHSSFGLYVSPTYRDRIFIGPYFLNYDGDDVETLKYINESLVSSESFNRMTGNPNYKCGHWMYERPYYHTPKNYLKDTVDLTKEDSVMATQNTSLLSRPSAPSSDEHQIITHNGFPVNIKNSKPRSPSEFNRYIITNIPHFGYLGAFQPENSSILEVSWPFEKKVLQFENADHARDFLQERFNQLLQPVPGTFKIHVIVLIQLNISEHKPINSDFLSGHCICGDFGIYNFKELTDEFCERELKTTKEQITKLFAKRAHDYIRKKIVELAELTGIDTNDKVNFNIGNILYKAQEEIKFQEHLRIQRIAEIYSKENVIMENMKKLFDMVKQLPTKERNIESKILNETLQIRPKRFGVNEVIEIVDDDNDNVEAKANHAWKQIEIMGPKSSDKHSKEYKNKTKNWTKHRNPKVARVAPFSSVSVNIVNKRPRLITDKIDNCELDEKNVLR